MPRLLVSVRSAEEAVDAARGGASIIDIKEPDQGALGRADRSVWKAVIDAIGNSLPISVALGELPEALLDETLEEPPGLSFRKVGMARGGANWVDDWRRLRERFSDQAQWVAVIYADWKRAEAPEPSAILDEALRVENCVGVLVDTWDKSRPSPVDRSWTPYFQRVRDSGRFSALAGSIDLGKIRTLAPILLPEIIAVRGAACRNHDRHGRIDSERVARLVQELADLSLSPLTGVRHPNANRSI